MVEGGVGVDQSAHAEHGEIGRFVGARDDDAGLPFHIVDRGLIIFNRGGRPGRTIEEQGERPGAAEFDLHDVVGEIDKGYAQNLPGIGGHAGGRPAEQNLIIGVPGDRVNDVGELLTGAHELAGGGDAQDHGRRSRSRGARAAGDGHRVDSSVGRLHIGQGKRGALGARDIGSVHFPLVGEGSGASGRDAQSGGATNRDGLALGCGGDDLRVGGVEPQYQRGNGSQRETAESTKGHGRVLGVEKGRRPRVSVDQANVGEIERMPRTRKKFAS